MFENLVEKYYLFFFFFYKYKFELYRVAAADWQDRYCCTAWEDSVLLQREEEEKEKEKEEEEEDEGEGLLFFFHLGSLHIYQGERINTLEIIY